MKIAVAFCEQNQRRAEVKEKAEEAEDNDKEKTKEEVAQQQQELLIVIEQQRHYLLSLDRDLALTGCLRRTFLELAFMLLLIFTAVYHLLLVPSAEGGGRGGVSGAMVWRCGVCLYSWAMITIPCIVYAHWLEIKPYCTGLSKVEQFFFLAVTLLGWLWMVGCLFVTLPLFIVPMMAGVRHIYCWSGLTAPLIKAWQDVVAMQG